MRGILLSPGDDGDTVHHVLIGMTDPPPALVACHPET
jgi:hypothetical protein